jgi:hypothetical protein
MVGMPLAALGVGFGTLGPLLGCSWGALGVPWDTLGARLALWATLGALLGCSWPLLGLSRPLLAPSLLALEPLVAALRRLLSTLGALLAARGWHWPLSGCPLSSFKCSRALSGRLSGARKAIQVGSIPSQIQFKAIFLSEISRSRNHCKTNEKH